MAELRSEIRNGVIGYLRPNGEFMPVIRGAAPDDGEKEGKEGEEEESSEEEEVSEEEESSEEDEEVKDPKAKLKAESEKNARLTKKLRQAERNQKKLNDRLTELENASKTDEQKKSEETEQTKEELKTIRAEYSRVMAERMLLDNDEIVKLPRRRRKMAIKMLIDDVEIDDDGDDNIEELVKALQDEEPDLFLVSSNGDGSEEEETEGPKASGRKVGGTKKKDKNSIDEAQLRNRFKVLRNT
jgi:predicted RNase H-like nuclease (RuvC/YqgF family)